MPTLKFCNFYEDGTSKLDAITCNHYQLYCPANGHVQVTTFRDDTDVNGVTRYVTPLDDGHADACYVENEQGKTINHIRPNHRLSE